MKKRVNFINMLKVKARLLLTNITKQLKTEYYGIFTFFSYRCITTH